MIVYLVATQSGCNQRYGVAFADLSLDIVIACQRFDQEETALDQFLVFVIFGQDVYHEFQATQFNDFLAKFISNRQTRKGWQQFADDRFFRLKF